MALVLKIKFLQFYLKEFKETQSIRSVDDIRNAFINAGVKAKIMMLQ